MNKPQENKFINSRGFFNHSVMGENGQELFGTVNKSKVTLHDGNSGVTGCWVIANGKAACMAVHKKITR